MSLLRTLAFLCASSLACISTHASTATYNITFTASGAAPASGSFTLTFDPTLTYASDTTTGLTVNNLSFTSGPSGFLYSPSDTNGFLTIGGLANTVGTIFGTAVDDYFVHISNFTIKPTFTLVIFTQSSTRSALTDTTGIAVVTQVAVTPEPSSFILLATGILGAGAAFRRRLA